MKKFKVTVTRVDEYEIEVDESLFNEEWKKGFEESFWKIFSLKTIAEDLAINQARFGSSQDFIEGYGYIKRNGELPFSFADFNKDSGDWLPEDERRKATEGLNIIIIDEDNEIECETEEIEN